MDFLESLIASPWWYLVNVFDLVSVVLLLLFMNFSAKHRNHKLSAGWYICGFFFPLITVFVFLSQRKKFPGPDTKVCYQCENKYPETFVMCTRCLIELPDIDKEENTKNQKRAKGLGIGFAISQAIAIVAVTVLIGMTVSAVIDEFEALTGSSRIGIENEAGDTVYYDKKGNAYDDPYAVVLYDEEGRTYTYTVKDVGTDAAEGSDAYYYEDYFYVRDDGEEFDVYNSYVTEDGWFFYDENYEVYYDYDEYDEELTEDTDTTQSEEEMMSELMDSIYNYKYYEEPYVDEKGNCYYMAEEASWNEKGELITAENDPTVTEEATE